MSTSAHSQELPVDRSNLHERPSQVTVFLSPWTQGDVVLCACLQVLSGSHGLDGEDEKGRSGWPCMCGIAPRTLRGNISRVSTAQCNNLCPKRTPECGERATNSYFGVPHMQANQNFECPWLRSWIVAESGSWHSACWRMIPAGAAEAPGGPIPE